MPFAGYSDFNDCVSKNRDKSDPQAYCGAIKHQVEKNEGRRHRDFERIHSEFLSSYVDQQEAEQLYYDWLKVMELDETRGYDQTRESFLWTKDMLQLVREDEQNKYYEVEVGFPSKSMNDNIYKKRDLVAASLSMKGKHPSLNHNDKYWFSPKNPLNRWGNIEIVDARFHEGISKALIAVPKNMACPFNPAKTMTGLIDNKRIVNVSLEGHCSAGVDRNGECEGFVFGDPPFTLLTKDVLPGIPMTRIKPLESYMPSQSSLDKIIKIKVKENMKIKLVPKRKEESDPAKMGLKTHSLDSNVYNEPAAGTGTGGPSGATFRGNLQNVSQQTNVAMGSDPAAKKPEGIWQIRIADPNTPYPKEGATGTPLTVKPSDQPDLISPADPMPEVDSHQGPSRTTGVSPDLTTSELPSGDSASPEPAMKPTAPSEMPPKPPHDCPQDHVWSDADGKCVPTVAALATEQNEEPKSCGDGFHWDPDVGDCVPDADTSEAVKRIKAELKADGLMSNLEHLDKAWTGKYSKLYELFQRQIGRNKSQEDIIRQQQNNLTVFGTKIEDLRVEMNDLKRQYSDAATLNTKFSRLIEQLKTERDQYFDKYQKSLAANLDLSKKLTLANEDYLSVTKEKEELQEKLGKARILAKKTLRIKV